MLRKDISRAAANVLEAIEESGFLPMCKNVFEGQSKEVTPEMVLGAFTVFVRRYEQFGKAEREFLAILELEFICDPVFWASAMQEFRSPPVAEAYHSIRFAMNHLPRMISLLSRASDDTADPIKSDEEPKKNALSQLSVTVIEERQQSSPERLVLVLESIDGLYRACAQFLGESEADLCVVACDSGSDKSFDFLGAAKIVDCVKQVILSFWDKIVFFREDKTARRLELVAQSLPILDELAEMRKSGKLEAERAELIRRQVIESITKFGKAGVTIPEIENFTVYNPRQLMKPEPKLLVGPKEASPEVEQGKQESDEARSPQIDDPEFQAYMEKMAREFRVRKTESTDASGPEQAEKSDDEPDKPH